MTNFFLTSDFINQIQNQPKPDVGDYRFPMADDDKLLFFLPKPNNHIQVVVMPSPAGVMIGGVVVRDTYHPFTLEASGVSYMRKISEKWKDHLSGVACWILFTIIAINSGKLTLEVSALLTGRERRIAKQYGDENRNTYRIASLPSHHYLPNQSNDCQKTGIKMRWHQCRGHWRNHPSGKRVWVRAHYRGDKTIGRVFKDYTTGGKR